MKRLVSCLLGLAAVSATVLAGLSSERRKNYGAMILWLWAAFLLLVALAAHL